MQINPNSYFVGKKKDIEKEFHGLVFDGPGLYLTENEVLIVQVKNFNGASWFVSWTEETTFECALFNNPISKTIFAEVIPIRQEIK